MNVPPRGRGRQPVCGQAKGRAVPRQAQGAPLCGKGPAPRHRPRGGVRRRARPCAQESPRASRGCAEKPLPHPAHHTDKPPCQPPGLPWGPFHPPPSEAWQPLPPHRRAVYGPRPSSRTQPLKGTAPLCAQSPRAAKAPSPAPPTRGRQAQGAPLYMGKPPAGHALRQSAPHRWGSFLRQELYISPIFVYIFTEL